MGSISWQTLCVEAAAAPGDRWGKYSSVGLSPFMLDSSGFLVL